MTSVESTTHLTSEIARCPGCGCNVRLVGRVLIGEVFGCGHCGAQVEVASSDPVELEPFARVEEEEEDFV